MPYLPEEAEAFGQRAPPPVSSTYNSYSTRTDALGGEESKASDIIMLEELRSDGQRRERGEAGTGSDRRALLEAPSSSCVQPAGDVGAHSYKLYKMRFAGLVAIMVLNVAGGMNWPWFGPIANDSTFPNLS